MNKRDIVNKIQDLLIVREDDGSYNLFGKFTIARNELGYYVIQTSVEETLDFSSLKHAVTWCVFNKNKKFKEIKRIHELDTLMGSLDVAIAQHKKLAEKASDRESKEIYLAKLIEEKRKKRLLNEEIDEYVQISKYMQNKQFQENSIR